MKKLMLLLIITITSLTVFSQTGTRSSDTLTIRLTTAQAKRNMIDLIRCDSIKAINEIYGKTIDILNNQMRLQNTQIVHKDSSIAYFKQLIISKDTIISLKDKQAEEWKSLSVKLQEDNEEKDSRIKKLERKSLWSKISGGTIVAVLGVLLAIK